MRPTKRGQSGQQDLLRSRLDQIVDLAHPLAKLARGIDWSFLEERLGAVYTDRPGRPPLPTRLMAGLAILKHMHNLSDEVLCERWLENPYYQLLCGEEFFCHKLAFDRSSMTRWRQRMGEEKLIALLQESLHLATRSGAAKPADFTRVIVDTTVQPKAITFPTDAKRLQRARERLVKLAQKHGIKLRQSYVRVGKFALIRHQRYAHAKQFKRANRALKTLRTYLGRVPRDIGRQIVGDTELKDVFAQPLRLARRVHEQRQRQRGPKVYSLHAPEVECIGKGKAHRPYEFGVKVSVATPLQRCRGGQFVAHVAALPGNPCDGHTLAKVIPAITQQIGVSLTRVIADAGYRGHNAPRTKGLRVYTSGQKCGVTDQIKRELRRRSAVEPVIGHLKEDHRIDRNYLGSRAMRQMLSSPRLATTSGSWWPGSPNLCAHCWQSPSSTIRNHDTALKPLEAGSSQTRLSAKGNAAQRALAGVVREANAAVIEANMTRPAERVVAFYNQRGTAEQWIKEGKNALTWTRLSCRRFTANAVRLQLHALAYNLANFLRTLTLPDEVKQWSMTTLRNRLVKIGARIVRHGRSITFQMAEVMVPRGLFQTILAAIAALRPLPPERC